MIKHFLKYSTLAVSITTLLTACGGSSNDSSEQAFVPKAISGLAVDFYVKNADVKFDDCNAEQFNNLKTKEDGSFTFNTTADCKESAITITGGTDTVTSLPFTGTLKLKKTDLQALSTSKIVLSPLTTLQYYVNDNAKINDIIKNLGLSFSGDVSQYDPVATGSAHDMAVIFVLQQLATQLEDSLQAINKGDGSKALTQDQATQIAFQAIIGEVSTKPLFKSDNAIIQTSVLNDILKNAVDAAEAKIADSTTEIDSSFSTQIQSNISSISTQINLLVANSGTGSNLANNLQNNSNVLGNITESLKTPVYGDFKFAGFSINEIKGSSINNRLQVSRANINTALAVDFKLQNTSAEVNDSVKLAFKLSGRNSSNAETLDVLISDIQITFDKDGKIIKSKIPSGTSIKIATTLKNVTTTSFTTRNDININSNGSISLSDLIQSDEALLRYYNSYIDSLAVNDRIDVTAYVLPITYVIDPSLALTSSLVTINGSSFTGESLTGYFILN